MPAFQTLPVPTGPIMSQSPLLILQFEFLLFFAVSGVSMAIGTALQSFLITCYGLQTTLAFGANIFCSLMINYAMRKFVIFKG